MEIDHTPLRVNKENTGVDVFREELELHGWPVVGLTENPFEDYDVIGAEVLVAAK